MTKSTAKNLSVLMALLLLSACGTTHTVEVRPSASSNIATFEPGSSSYYNIGKNYLATSDYGLATAAFRRSLMHEDNELAALNGLAITYDMLGRFDLSQKYYEQALAMEPGSPVTYSNLAYSMHLQGENKDAIQLAEAAERLSRGKDEKTVSAISKAVTGNISIAEKKQKIEKAPASNPEKFYTVEKTDSRSWEVTEKTAIPHRKPLLYKASYSVNSILEGASAHQAAPEETNEAALTDKPATPVKPVTYRIINGTGRPKMAFRMSEFIKGHGVTRTSLANASHFGHDKSVIKYAPGMKDEAMKVASLLPVPIELVETQETPADVVLIIGNDLLTFDASLYQDYIDI